VYRSPATPFVARFVGKVNDLAVEMTASSRVRLRGHALEFSVPQSEMQSGEARLLIRPEDIRVTSSAGGEGLQGRVDGLQFGGATTSLDVAIAGTNHVVRVSDSTRAMQFGIGDAVSLAFDMERALLTRE
jgi:iron(III) transport system ATP-binding protein